MIWISLFIFKKIIIVFTKNYYESNSYYFI